MDLQVIVNTTRREKSLSLRYAGLSALEVLRIEEIEVEIHDIDAELAMPLPIEWSMWLTQRRARLVNERNSIDQKPVIAPAILEQKILTFDEWHPKDCWNQLRFERGHLERVEVALRIFLFSMYVCSVYKKRSRNSSPFEKSLKLPHSNSSLLTFPLEELKQAQVATSWSLKKRNKTFSLGFENEVLTMVDNRSTEWISMDLSQ
jgi:hypothetical protein